MSKASNDASRPTRNSPAKAMPTCCGSEAEDAVPTPHHCPEVWVVMWDCVAATPHPLLGAVK